MSHCTSSMRTICDATRTSFCATPTQPSKRTSTGSEGSHACLRQKCDRRAFVVHIWVCNRLRPTISSFSKSYIHLNSNMSVLWPWLKRCYKRLRKQRSRPLRPPFEEWRPAHRRRLSEARGVARAIAVWELARRTVNPVSCEPQPLEVE